ncbi:MAG: type II toxin-antitoxin system HicB family antitoxin [bacterium]
MLKQCEYKIEYDFDKETKQIMVAIPELNHVSSFGKTFAEAEVNVKEAAVCYIEALMLDRMEIPKPAFTTEGTYIKLFMPEKI